MLHHQHSTDFASRASIGHLRHASFASIGPDIKAPYERLKSVIKPKAPVSTKDAHNSIPYVMLALLVVTLGRTFVMAFLKFYVDAIYELEYFEKTHPNGSHYEPILHWPGENDKEPIPGKIDDLWQGFLASSFYVTYGIGSMVNSYFANLYGRRFIILVDLAGLCVGFLCQGLAQTYWQLYFARVFSGLFVSLPPIVQVYINDIVAKENLSYYSTVKSAILAASFLLGPVLSLGIQYLSFDVYLQPKGKTLQHPLTGKYVNALLKNADPANPPKFYSVKDRLNGKFRVGFLVAAALGGITFLLCYFKVVESQNVEKETSDETLTEASMSKVEIDHAPTTEKGNSLKNTACYLIVLCTFLVSSTDGVMQVLAIQKISDARYGMSWDETEVTVFFVIFGFFSILILGFYGKVLESCGFYNASAIGVAITATICLLFDYLCEWVKTLDSDKSNPLNHTYQRYIVSIGGAIYAMGYQVFQTALPDILCQLNSEIDAASWIGFFYMLQYFGVTLCFPISIISTKSSINAAFVLTGILAFLGLGALLSSKSYRNQMRKVEASGEMKKQERALESGEDPLLKP